MSEEIKLNVGCGGNILQGWRNTDADMDISKPLPYPDNSVEAILAEHVGEHLTAPQFFGFMEEAYRVLKRGCVLRVCVPELARLSHEKRKDIIINHGHLQVCCEENIRLMLEAAGFTPSMISRTGRKEIDGHYRQIGIDLDTLETLRMEAIK